jgi:hypothetical protein
MTDDHYRDLVRMPPQWADGGRPGGTRPAGSLPAADHLAHQAHLSEWGPVVHLVVPRPSGRQKVGTAGAFRLGPEWPGTARIIGKCIDIVAGHEERSGLADHESRYDTSPVPPHCPHLPEPLGLQEKHMDLKSFPTLPFPPHTLHVPVPVHVSHTAMLSGRSSLLVGLL